jgi:uncharacterized membrane protein (DUF373 family)
MAGKFVNGACPSPLAERASVAFLNIELVTHVILGLMLVAVALLGIGSAGLSLWHAVTEHGTAASIVAAIDRLLFVLMVVEILHTVRVSFQSGVLVCEPFLIVGLIASIRRVLVITLESSQASAATASANFASTMVELGVLAGLILVMVVSIYLLRRSDTEA